MFTPFSFIDAKQPHKLNTKYLLYRLSGFLLGMGDN